jgi:septum formation protein
MTRPLTLILASASPRRRELLAALGLAIECVPADVDESRRNGESPPEHVLRVAREKAAAVAARRPDSPVLGADTIVVLGDEILGKPADRADAGRMLDLLSGRTHTVLTAICVALDGCEATHLESAAVTFVSVPPALREWYLATGEGDDKAGAYAVQGVGAVLVATVDGNVQAVIGLPLAPLPGLLARLGLLLSAEGAALTLSRRA